MVINQKTLWKIGSKSSIYIFILSLMLISGSLLYAQTDTVSSYINSNQMKRLDSLKNEFFREFSVPYEALKSQYSGSIRLDTTLTLNDISSKESEAKVIITDSLLIGIGKSRKYSEWHVSTLVFRSQHYLSKFNLKPGESYDDFMSKYDSTVSYISKTDDDKMIKYYVDINETDEFKYFTEFIFYFEDQKLMSVSVDYLENR